MAGELSLKTPSTGLVTLVPTDTATDKTITLPATTGTMVVQDGTNTTTINNLAYTGTLTGGTGVINIGSGQVYKDASGNVGIGTASPVSKLNITNGAIRLTSAYELGWGDNSIYLAANTSTGFMQFVTGSNERMRLDTAGNLGLGVTPTSGWSGSFKVFQIAGQSALWSNGSATFVSTNNYNDGGNKYIGTGGASRYYQSGGQHIWENAPAGTAGNAISFTQAMTLTAAGHLLVGTTTATNNRLIVAGPLGSTVGNHGSSIRIINTDSGDYATIGAGIVGNTNGGMQFSLNGTSRAVIDADGNFLVGMVQSGGNGCRLSPGATGIINNDAAASGHVFMSFRRSGAEIGYISQNGTTGVTYSTTSDYRLKENVQPMQGALSKVQQLKPCTYTWKSDGSTGQGFIAHELQAVVPDCVTGEKDAVDADGKPKYQGVDTSFLVATLTAAIQELTARLEVLENK